MDAGISLPTHTPRPPAARAAAAPVLALHEGRAGNRRQALALAAALSPDARECVLAPGAPWRWLAPRRLPFDDHAFGPAFSALLRQAPGIAIGCGRQAALATRVLRAHGWKAVQILDPRLPPRHWDAVVAPAHDALLGDNVLTLTGSLNPVDEAWLAAGRAAFVQFGNLPAPRIGVLIGGPTRHAPWTTDDARRAFARIAGETRASGGSVMATASRRTPAAVVGALRAAFAAIPGFVWADATDGPNPYAGLLGWADRLACTPDSINLLSEACATGVPVELIAAEHIDGKPLAFVGQLRALRRIAGADAVACPLSPLRETARIAALLRQRLAAGR